MRRVRRRYLALKAEGARVFGEREVLDAVWGMVFRLFGEVGASRVDLRLVRGFDVGVEGVVVVRCSHRFLGWVRAAVAAVTEVGGVVGVVRVVGVSGTLRGLRRRVCGGG